MEATEHEQILKEYLVTYKTARAHQRRHTLAWTAAPLSIGLCVLAISFWQLGRVQSERRTLERRKVQLVTEVAALQQAREDARLAVIEMEKKRAEAEDQARLADSKLAEVHSRLDPSAGKLDRATIEQIRKMAAPDVKPVAGSGDKPNARQLWTQGYQTYLAGDRAQAKKLYQQANQLDPDYAPALNSLGRIAGEEGNTAEETRLYAEALKRDGKYVPALNNMAIVEYHKGNLDKAEQLATQALALRPGYTSSVEILRQIKADRQRPGG
jgi:tetratricopeptide (TPR) repeat protein